MAREIIEAIRQINGAQNANPLFVLDAEVVRVSEASRTCEVKTIGGDAPVEIVNVRLMAEVDDGVLLVPAVGSRIIVAYNKNLLPFILQFSEVKKYIFTVDGATLDVVDGNFVFNDGNNKGFVKIKELTEKLNNIENLLNGFIGVFNAHTHPANGAPPTTTQTQTLTATQITDIENEKIKH